MGNKLIRVEIQQLDSEGEVYRTFLRVTKTDELDMVLDNIERGYSLDSTRVLINGTPWLSAVQ